MSVPHLNVACFILVLCSTLITSDNASQPDDKNRRCYNASGYCYISPRAERSWDSADTWCQNHTARLPVIRNRAAQLEIAQYVEYLRQSKPVVQNSIFLNAKEYLNLTDRQPIYMNVDGTPSNLHIHRKVSTNFYRTFINYDGHTCHRFVANQFTTASYVCQYPVSSHNCSSAELKHGGFCFIIYRSSNWPVVSWYSARNNCSYDGGDLAVINRTSESFLTDKLKDGGYYWIGARDSWWTWQHTPISEPERKDFTDVIYTDWDSESMRRPRNNNCECVCMNTNQSGSWYPCNCRSLRLVVCQIEPMEVPISGSNIATTDSNYGCHCMDGFHNKKNYPEESQALPISVSTGVFTTVVIILIISLSIALGVIVYKRKSNTTSLNNIQPIKDFCANTESTNVITVSHYEDLFERSKPNAEEVVYQQIENISYDEVR